MRFWFKTGRIEPSAYWTILDSLKALSLEIWFPYLPPHRCWAVFRYMIFSVVAQKYTKSFPTPLPQLEYASPYTTSTRDNRRRGAASISLYNDFTDLFSSKCSVQTSALTSQQRRDAGHSHGTRHGTL